jgi:sugar (pentulose or hexulose) kinase
MAMRLHELYTATGLHRSRLVGSGNAVRKGEVLREVLSAVFGMPLGVSAHVEEAAAGAAILCGFPAGSPGAHRGLS